MILGEKVNDEFDLQEDAHLATLFLQLFKIFIRDIRAPGIDQQLYFYPFFRFFNQSFPEPIAGFIVVKLINLQVNIFARPGNILQHGIEILCRDIEETVWRASWFHCCMMTNIGKSHYLCSPNNSPMIRSMTGFGKSQVDLPGKLITVEIRSLNSKQLDLNFRAPSVYREKEMTARSVIAQRMERGKVDVNISVESKNDQAVMTINKSIALQYLDQLKDLASSIPDNPQSDMLPILVRMPDVLKSEKEEFSEEEWAQIEKAITAALDEADKFRIGEGAILRQEFIFRIEKILNLLVQVAPLESARLTAVRAKFEMRLEEIRQDKSYDQNRLEQELVYYFEKLDITEEKQRLRKHCDYFILTLDENESPGKKLGFVTQEIGREINTLGSKANDAQIQVLVVQMKDELEKIKEQLANIL